MIFYFSATGNSKYVADILAKELRDRTMDIAECIRRNRYVFELDAGENVGFVIPTYFYGLPKIAETFLQKVETVNRTNYVYFVTTCGGKPGRIGFDAHDLLVKRALGIDSMFCVEMPDNYAPMFKTDDSEKNLRTIEAASETIDFIIHCVKRRDRGIPMENTSSKIAVKIARSMYKAKTDKFKVTDACTGCGRCEELCPTDSIRVEDGKPVWVNDVCTLCLGCLHRCPAFAIEYGNSRKNGQYLNPYVEFDEE